MAGTDLVPAPAEPDAAPEIAWRPIIGVAVGVVVVLLLLSERYGYHRDELYFLAAGRHLAWGYPDQPPFVPFLARVISAVASGSLVALRTPSAVGMAAVVVMTGLTAREFGASRTAQLIAA